ncbi:MAG: hypothetical protein ACR2K6_00395 [Solirubrobacterales bacterium]
MLSLALSNGDVIVAVVVLAVPLALIAFLGAGSVYGEIGKGDFAMDHDEPARGQGVGGGGGGFASQQEQEAEIRQMLEAKSFRRQKRGKPPLDIEEEMRKMTMPTVSVGTDASLVEEVRQLVVARNARRLRQGKEPLNVEEEIQRQLRELESMGH